MWNKHQQITQFQGEGSSHELAALLLTECIEFSRTTLKLPTYVLYLDARSAFDVVKRELLIRHLFHLHGADQTLLYIDNRLASRQTVVDYDGILMGPIHDMHGLEQGGISSSDLYKIYGHEQLSLAQQSSLGIPLGNLVVSSIGQADDTALISNDLVFLSYLLKLSNLFCTKSLVELSAEKTRLQCYSNSTRASIEADIDNLTNPIEINGTRIPFSQTASHVGIVRSVLIYARTFRLSLKHKSKNLSI